MKVICNKNTTRLVKGSIYEVIRIDNLNKNSSAYFSPRISIKISDFSEGSFSPKNFTYLDGKPIDQINWISPDELQKSQNQKDSYISAESFKTLKKGDIIICKYPSKYLDRNKMYKISDIISESTKNPSGYTHLTQKIKIEGYNRWLNYYRFRLCTKQEKRSLSLGNIFGEKNEVAEVDLKTRKIDKMSDIDKKKTIINCIFFSMLDANRNNLSSIEWALKKGKIYDLEYSDFEPFMNKKLSDLVKMFD